MSNYLHTGPEEDCAEAGGEYGSTARYPERAHKPEQGAHTADEGYQGTVALRIFILYALVCR